MSYKKYMVSNDLVIFDPFGDIPLGSSVTDSDGSIFLISDKRVHIPNTGWGCVVKSSSREVTRLKKDKV